jgi:uncharacterized protein DUF6789
VATTGQAARRITHHWAFKAAIAGLSGSAAHSLLMYSKSRLGLLPAFQPYHELQIAIGQWIGKDVHPAVPWLLSYLNGSTVAGMLFGRSYRVLPGGSGAVKGLVFGVLGWLLMGTVAFPLLGLGLFASDLGLGMRPALFSLAMLLAYSIVLGTVYGLLDRSGAAGKS